MDQLVRIECSVHSIQSIVHTGSFNEMDVKY